VSIVFATNDVFACNIGLLVAGEREAVVVVVRGACAWRMRKRVDMVEVMSVLKLLSARERVRGERRGVRAKDEIATSRPPVSAAQPSSQTRRAIAVCRADQ